VILSLYLALVPAVSAATCQDQVLSTGSPVDHGHRLASYDTSLVVSGGVDYGRRRNVYGKKPQRCAKDNRTVHLTAHSDKSVACVTNNKRLYSTFCTVEGNYCQTQCIARPLCDSRATCQLCFKLGAFCCAVYSSESFVAGVLLQAPIGGSLLPNPLRFKGICRGGGALRSEEEGDRQKGV